jgi:hypothetical protein
MVAGGLLFNEVNRPTCPKCGSWRYDRRTSGYYCLDCGKSSIIVDPSNTAPRRIGEAHGNVWGEAPRSRCVRSMLRRKRGRQPEESDDAKQKEQRGTRNSVYQDAQRLLRDGHPYDAFKQLLLCKRALGSARNPDKIMQLWDEIKSQLPDSLRRRAVEEWERA